MRLSLLLTLFALPALAGPNVVIDAGHGGGQPGATSPTGYLEKNLALTLAKKVKARLEADVGARVTLTRATDRQVSLPDRVDAANRQKPDLFISLHANSMPTKKTRLSTAGIETYFLSAAASGEAAKKVAARENAEAGGAPRGASGDTLSFILADLQRAEAHHDSSRLAYALQESLIEETGAEDRGVQQAPFYVLMGLEAPAVLVEVGFISHPAEGTQLAESAYQDRLAAAISLGVRKFLAQVQKRDVKASAARSD